MTGLEPHPILRLPTQQEARAMGQMRFAQLCELRAKRLIQERRDPFTFGYEPEIWHVVDDLLVDGNTVVLDLSRIAKLYPPGLKPNEMVDVPKEIASAPEIWCAGSNRSSKSEYGGKKCLKVLRENENARGWSFADTGPVSIARQQPIFWRYMPMEVKRLAQETGKAKAGTVLNISYKQKTGFAEQSFVLPNGSQHWFKNYEQDIANVEGDQLDIIWLDELRNPDLLKTLRGRMGDRGGIIIVTFTSIDDNYSAIVNEYEKGARTVLDVPAELLPIKDEQGKPSGKFERVPRVKVAGPGSDGNQRANIVYFHITDNPYYGYEAALRLWQKTKQAVVFGKERFYAMYRNATRNKILSRVYGMLPHGSRNQFPNFNDAVHVVDPEAVPANGTNYHIVDPCDGRNWAQIWIRVDAQGDWWIWMEWPSYSTNDWPNKSPSAYIPGIGDPGPWALPGEPFDGVRGPAQTTFGFGLERYAQEIGRCESGQRTEDRGQKHKIEIEDRWMDSRYGANPRTDKEGQTTLIEQMGELGMMFRAASGKDIVEGIDLIRDKLDYDRETELGKFSAVLGRLNRPRLHISRDCPNVIYAVKEWTGRDKQHGACKDFIDVLRYACLARLEYVDEGAFTWSGGGGY